MALLMNAKDMNRRGIAMVEMALVLPLLIFLTFGMLQYGVLFLRTQEINRAAREGARIGSQLGATLTEAEAAAQFVMTNAGFSDPSGYSVSAAAAPFELTAGDPNSAVNAVTVTVVLPLQDTGFTVLPGMQLLVPANLTATVTMIQESG